jgi:hypothetical protein
MELLFLLLILLLLLNLDWSGGKLAMLGERWLVDFLDLKLPLLLAFELTLFCILYGSKLPYLYSLLFRIELWRLCYSLLKLDDYLENPMFLLLFELLS